LTRPAQLAAGAALVLLAACGGTEAEQAGNNMADVQAAVAATLDEQADKLEERAEQFRDQANMTREDAAAGDAAVEGNLANTM
jgi:hypothetical protein